MEFSTNKKGNFTLLTILETRLDAANAPLLRKKVNELITSNSQRIILDISAVEFMDSSSLGALVSILKMIGGSGELIIAGANGIVADLFELTQMNRVFRMTPDVESAGQMTATA